MKYRIISKRKNKRSIFILECENIKNVKDYKNEISRVNYILPEYINLKIQSITLKDDSEITDCERLENFDTVMYINVMVHEIHESSGNCKNCHKLSMNFDDTVRDLRIIYCQEVKVSDVIFKCDKECREKDYLSKYLTKPKCFFTAFFAVSVIVTNERGDNCELKCYENDTLAKIRRKLVYKRVLTNFRSPLMIGNNILKGEGYLYKYGKMNPFKVFVGMNISLNYRTQNLLNIAVNVDTKVSYLKTILSETLGKKPEALSLSNDGKNLDDENTIGFYLLKENDQISVLLNTEIYIINTANKEMFDFVIKKGQTIGSIKEELSTRNGISANRLKLMLKNEELKDDVVENSLELEDNTIMLMSVKLCLTIVQQYKCLSSKNASSEIIVDSGCTIEQLRASLSQQSLTFDVNSSELYHNDRILIDGSIDDYHIQDGDTLTTRSRVERHQDVRQLLLNIERTKNDVWALLITEHQTVISLKIILREQCNVSVSSIRLWFSGRELVDDEVVMMVEGIESGSTVIMEVIEVREMGLGDMRVRVRMSLGEGAVSYTRDVNVRCDATVAALREILNSEFVLTTEDYVVSLVGLILKNENTLSTYCVGDGDEIVVSHSVMVRYVVGGDHMSARVNRYPVIGGDRVGDLKARIAGRMNLGVVFINLLYNGEVLDNGDSMREAGIGNGSYLLMLSTLNGGRWDS